MPYERKLQPVPRHSKVSNLANNWTSEELINCRRKISNTEDDNQVHEVINMNMEVEPEFVNCFRKLVNCENDSVVQEIWKKLDELENLESGSKNSTYDCNRNYDKFLRSILTESTIRNVWEIPKILEWFSKFPFVKTASNPISDDIARFLVKSAENFNIKDRDPPLVGIIQVMSDNRERYLPEHNNHTNLCTAIVEVLAWMHVPEEVGIIKRYNEGLLKIRDFLIIMCRNEFANESTGACTNTALTCFKKLCQILLVSKTKSTPSSAVVIVLQLVDENLWKLYMSIAVKQIINEFADECKIVAMLSTFCKWLVEPPYTNMEYLSMWLTLFIKGLENDQRFRISNEVAENILPNIFSRCLELDKFYSIDVTDNVILNLLIQIRSLDLFHKIIKQISTFLYNIPSKAPLSSNKKNVIQTIINITHTLLKRFSEHLQSGCDLCHRAARLIVNFSKDNNQTFNSHIPEESEEMEVSYPSTSTGFGRLDTTKVGLMNLGNTCYMNSVLQALVMTRRFCNEVLLYKNDLSDQPLLKNLQNLFALLKYSPRNSLAPTDILRASRPAYFMPGQQQDSSEFLCHLLDVMYEQEKSALMKNSSSDQSISMKSKEEDKEMEVEEAVGPSSSPLNDDSTSKSMARWTTEENLSEGASLQRKTQSLADFTQGEGLAQTQNGLTDSHSDSTDSGIQSVGGEDSTSSSSSTSSPIDAASPSSYLVHRVFGGELKVIYQCGQCDNESHNTDRFRDLQLCFLDNLPITDAIKVQDLINVNYLSPEKLTGDNKYRCDKCARLCDAQRIIKILQAPDHLILTLKHFRYNSESRLRTKLRNKVIYNETINLPVLDQANETYQLYAAVVHSGYSLDYGHYVTYACDSKNRWYRFNDNYVTETTLDDFKKLEAPDTPYILFYKKCTDSVEEDAPELTSLNKSLQDYIEEDKRKYQEDRRNPRLTMGHNSSRFNTNNSWDRDKNDDDDGNPPPSNCRNAINIPNQTMLF